MKILFVLPAYEPAWALGGVVRSASNLCRELAAQGHAVSVYTTNASGMKHALDASLNQPTDLGGVEVIYFPPTFGLCRTLDSRCLVSRLRETVQSYDIVYISAVWQWIGYEATRICRCMGVSCIFGLHGSLDRRLMRRHWFRKRFYWQIALKKALSRSSALHFTTEYERSQCQRTSVESFIVPNGVNTDEFKQISSRTEIRKDYAIPLKAPLLISVGRVNPKKRLDLLIHALSLVKEVYLIIVGPDDSPLARKYKEVCSSLGVAARVIWAGYKTTRELSELYSAADVFVLLSEDENFGMSAVEAMACGVPILVSQYVGVWHEVKDFQVGIAVELQPESVAQTLDSLVKNPSLWKAWGVNTRCAVQERFAIDRVANLMSIAFEDTLTGRRSPQCNWTH